MGLGGISPAQLFIVLLLPLVIVVVPFWQIFKKAGFSPFFSLLMLIPLVNLIMLFVLAFVSWPALDRKPV